MWCRADEQEIQRYTQNRTHWEESLAIAREISEKEANKNWALTERPNQLGKPVIYGQVVQLQHVRSKKFLTACQRTLAEVDKDCIKLELRTEGSQNSWFSLEPRFKFRQAGTGVFEGDQVGRGGYGGNA
jgi:hypothetical protein